MGRIIESAVIRDIDGEVPWPLEDAQKSAAEGHFRYIGFRTYDDFVEYIFHFG
jgi:hypothetical protein